MADERTIPWHDFGRRSGVGSSAALPLLNGGRAEGVLIFNSLEKGAFTPELVELLQRLAQNVAFALENFDRADEKGRAEKQKERLAGMFEALSATNEAIIRVKTRTELFELVCQAAVLGGMFTSATIALVEPDGEYLRIAATKGLNYERMRNRRFATSEDNPEGRGLSGTSFRTRQPCIINDFLADPRTAFWHSLAKEDGTRSGAGFPLLQNGNKAVGVLLFLSRDEDAFTGDLVQLLARLAENVSFALDNFDRADEKARTEEQKERLTRMFAALCATNEAIMRAKTRTEMYRPGLRRGVQRRKVHLHDHRSGRSRQRRPRCRCRGGTGRGHHTKPAGSRPTTAARRVAGSAGQRFVPVRPASAMIIGRTSEPALSTAAFAATGPGRARHFRCWCTATPSASSCSWPPKRIHSLRNSSNCCSGWPTTCLSRWRISSAPTKKPGPTNASNIWRHTTV